MRKSAIQKVKALRDGNCQVVDAEVCLGSSESPRHAAAIGFLSYMRHFLGTRKKLCLQDDDLILDGLDL